MAPEADALPNVLRGGKEPTWACSGCAIQGNWASRIACRRCGAKPSKKVYDKAIAEHNKAKAARRRNASDGAPPSSGKPAPWARSSGEWPKPDRTGAATKAASIEDMELPQGVPQEMWDGVLAKAREHKQAEQLQEDSKPRSAKQLAAAVDTARWALKNKQQQLERAKERQQKAAKEAEEFQLACTNLQVDLDKALAAQASALQSLATEAGPAAAGAATMELFLPSVKDAALAGRVRAIMEELRLYEERVALAARQQREREEVPQPDAAAQAQPLGVGDDEPEDEEQTMDLDLEEADDATLANFIGSIDAGDPSFAKPTSGDLGEWRQLVRAKIAKSDESHRALRAAAVKGGVIRQKLKGKTSPATPAKKSTLSG